MKLKKIGISLRVETIEKYDERRDTISHDWINFLQKLNFVPILIPNNLQDTEGYISELKLDGIILSGGDNLGEFPERDETENRILEAAIKNSMPILGVCRGMQKINQYFGGTYETLSTSEHVGKEHLIDIKQEKFSTLFQSKTIKVNSFHYNIITKDTVGDNLIPFAFSKNDGTVEGFYHSKLPIIGVMWHPERDMISKHQTKLMEVFENKSLW